MKQFSAPKNEGVLQAELVESHISDAALVAAREGKEGSGKETGNRKEIRAYSAA
jgi:hypothetical protein